MLGRRFQPLFFFQNFLGVNTKDSDENKANGEWDEASIDIFSDPQGSLGSRNGFSAITSASIGGDVAWTGFYQFNEFSGGSRVSHFVGAGSDGNFYKFASNAYTELFDSLTTGVDVRWAFLTLDNQVLAVNGNEAPLIWAGTGSAATFETSVTADFCIEWQRYPWVHSTVDPRLVYYGILGNPDGAYVNFLNFDADGEGVKGLAKQGDDLLVGKRSHLYRVQFRGTDPLFQIYKVPTNVGPVNHWVFKELPSGQVIFLAQDFNFYMAIGDTVIPVGDNIKAFIRGGVNSRLDKAVSGLLYNRNQYWCSFTKISGSTTNDRTVVMDWNRPYRDLFGKLQYPWFIHSIGANAFAEVDISGQDFLYHGGYVGKVYKNDTTTADDGVAFSPTYKSKRISHGDPTLEKKYSKLEFSYDNKGDWNLNINFIIDNNAATEKITSQNMLGGVGALPLFDVAKFDEDSFATESDADVSKDIGRQGKFIQMTLSTTGLDEAWLVRYFSILAKGLRRVSRSRES